MTVRVPATTANLGPGFDILAMALQMQMTVTAETRDDSQILIDAGAQAPEDVRDPARNLICTSYARTCALLGVADDARGVQLSVDSEIPVSRGLGSSAACTVAGVVIAAALRGDGRLDEHAVIAEAAAIEGHADNAAAAMLGGLVICAPGATTQRITVPDGLRSVLFIPSVGLSTRDARRVVPTEVSRADAIFNAARCALLVRAMMSGDSPALGEAMEDRWHQPQRAGLMPWLPEMLTAARDAGAHGTALSGAGPTILALCSGDTATVEAAMVRCAARNEVSGSVRVVAIRNFGTRVDLTS